jgi:glycosyltransferase involved in cell wall biosynthesis
VLDAWEVLGAEPAAAHLLVVGDGPDLASHRKRLAHSPALARSVTLAGALPRPRALAALAACDAACGDCWSDAGFPAKAFEYMALGLPALIQDRPQVREVLSHGETALLWGDPDDLTGQVRLLATDTALRARLGAAGRKALLASHTEELREVRFRAAIADAALLLEGG